MAVNSPEEIHELVICANCFIKKDDKYLVLRRSPHKKWAPGVIHPIGGKVELNENPYAAAIREVQEEAGLEVKNLKLEAVFMEIQPHPGDLHNWLIFHFSGDYAQGDTKTTEEGELLWLSADEIKQAELFPSVRLFINDILDKNGGAVFSTIEYDEAKQHIKKHSLGYLAN